MNVALKSGVIKKTSNPQTAACCCTSECWTMLGRSWYQAESVRLWSVRRRVSAGEYQMKGILKTVKRGSSGNKNINSAGVCYSVC